MKKFKYLSLILCLSLFLQCIFLPVHATETTGSQLPAETAAPADIIPQATEAPAFGTVCIQNGCRTIEGMVPLGGSDRRLESAQGAFLYEMNTDTVVYSYNPDLKLHPGHLTKIVLAMVVLENCDMDEVVTVTDGIQSYIPFGASHVEPEGLKSLEHLTVGDLLYALILTQANDAAVALAHHVAGTTDAFLTLMNNRVKQLGCVNTEFGNVSGLYTMESYSTGRDMAKIVREAIKNEDFVEIFGTREYTIPATDMVGEREFVTTNHLINDTSIEDFVDGRVTGGIQSYNDQTLASIACTAESNGMKYIAVVLGAIRVYEDGSWRIKNYGNFNDVTTLLQYGFDNFKVNRIIYDGMSLSQFKVAGGESNAVGQATVNIDSVVPINAQMENLYMTFNAVDGGLTAPIAKDQLIATMSIAYRNSVLAEAEVYAMGDVKAINDTGVTIRSTAARSDADASGALSVIGTICVIILGLAAAYLAFNAYMRSRIRAQRRRRRQNRRRMR